MGLIDGFFNSLFGSPEQVDTQPFMNQANQMNQYGRDFLDPNSFFYKTANAQQKKMLLDIYNSQASQQRNQLASQGINSNSINMLNLQAGANKATEGVNQFGTQLYGQGVQQAQGFFGLGNQALGQFGQAQQNNVDTQNSYNNQLLSLGGGLLSKYFTGGAAGGGVNANNNGWGNQQDPMSNFLTPTGSGGSFYNLGRF